MKGYFNGDVSCLSGPALGQDRQGDRPRSKSEEYYQIFYIYVCIYIQYYNIIYMSKNIK